MFKKKAVTGSELISNGMTMLTQATSTIEQGAELNANEIAANTAVVEELQARSAYLTDENKTYMKIVANFKKNILGE